MHEPDAITGSRRLVDLATTVGTMVLVALALAVAGLAGYRRFGRSPRAPAPVPAVVRGAVWQRAIQGPHSVGPADARVKVVVFNDYQCPFCASSAPELTRLRESYPRDVAIIYRQYPLKMLHPAAMDAAVASECAAAQGRFLPFHNLLFATQDSIGSKPWRDFAESAGVQDLGRFQQCLGEPAPREAVAADISTGRAVGVRGTPTILVDGIARTGGIEFTTLDSLVKVALRTRSTAEARR